MTAPGRMVKAARSHLFGTDLAIHPVVDEGLGNTSWWVETGNGRALVIDPVRDVRTYLQLADERGLTLAFSVETHLHADFVSGSRELAGRGATVLAPAAGGTAFPHHGLVAHDEVDLGGLRLEVLPTPGHTPEHLAYLLLHDGVPVALFSGGSLLVGTVARTDLVGPDHTERLTRQLWRSLKDGVLSLPDDLAVYPTHGAGSFCSAAAGAERWTTIGAERASNPLLSAPDEDAFVARLMSGVGTYPPYFLTLRELNRRGPTVYGDHPPILESLGVDEVRRLVAGGAELVDVRPFRDFGDGHVPGSLSIPLRPQFASWLGWLVAPGQPVVFVADADQDRDELVRQCLQIGYEGLAGELAGGIDAWSATGRPVDRIAVVEPAEVVPAQVFDVRQDAEFDAGHIPGSPHLELGALAEGVGELPAGPVTLMCGHGERAMSAASLLTRAGRRDVCVLAGGPLDWSTRMGVTLATGRS